MTNIDALTWSDIQSDRFQIALLPWGATEPHNLHLPYTTDNLLSRAISLDAAAKAEKLGIKSVVLPTIPFGSQNPGQTEFPFCIHLHTETQKALLRDIVSSLHRGGITKLIILNGHGGNSFSGIVRDLAVDFPDFLIVTTDWYKILDARIYFTEPGDHAGELETSLMLHYYPQWVKPRESYGSGAARKFTIDAMNNRKFWLPRNWKKVSEDTGIGNPKYASAEKGKIFAEAVTDEIAGFMKEFAEKSELYL